MEYVEVSVKFKKEYIRISSSKSELERTNLSKDKTGVFTGAYAINPVNNKEIPIWISDYVLATYGTGAIMAVPAHDQRDYEFARKFNIEVIQVLEEVTGTPKEIESNKESIVAIVYDEENDKYIVDSYQIPRDGSFYKDDMKKIFPKDVLREMDNVHFDGTINKLELEKAIFNIIFVDNEEIHNINKEYRNIDRVTDVISFALEDNKDIVYEDFRLLGDIYIAIDVAYDQAIEYNHSREREVCFLATHGILHLLGYDHMTIEEEKEMFDKQEELLNEFEIKR